MAAASARTREAARSTAGHATGHAASTASAVELHHDRVGDSLELLLVLLILLAGGLLVLVEPVDDLVNLGAELGLVRLVELLIHLGVVERVAQRVGVRLQAVLGRDAAGLSLVLLLELLGLSKHALNLLLGQAALVVGDGNVVGLAGALLESRDVHDTVGIEVEGDLNLRDTARSGRNARELKLAEQVVVLGALALTLVDLDEHTGLVVGEGREDLGLLGRNSGVARDELGHHATSGLDTERQRRNVEKEDLVGRLRGGVARQDGGLDGGTIGNGLIRVDRLVGLLAVEVVRNELLDTGDTGRATDKHDLVDLGLVDLGIRQDAVDRLQGRAEEILAELLEASTGDGGVEVDALKERVDLNRGLSRRRQGALGTLAGSAKAAQSTGIGRQVCEMLPLELVDEVVHKAVVEVLTAQVGVTSSRLDLEDALLNGQERHIEGTATEIEDQDVALAINLLVETVGNGSRGGLVDDTEHVQAGNETSILGGLALRIVEVGGNSDDSVGDGATEVGLSGLAHLGQDHGRDLLGREGLLLALELDLNDGLAIALDNLEGEVLHVGLDLGIGKLAADQALGIENGVVGVHGDLVLRGIADKALGVGKGDERRGRAVTLVVGDDFATAKNIMSASCFSWRTIATIAGLQLTDPRGRHRRTSRSCPSRYRRRGPSCLSARSTTNLRW
ncbi:c73ff6cb-8731-470e-9cf7-86bd75ccbeed [Thermothielavioides terrestris]|uniref:C73ff6cb-8731-470e-9cf7-86bd75ccbeed n=1 Tax=Thermothielavioides terrestris TaxID=2587410 RepID=A0A3S4EW06_9PEZI|nr:c73ff6cb-8731-470e-9cf7-86bd75ccbeed [Thermothielavioides terrestris]